MLPVHYSLDRYHADARYLQRLFLIAVALRAALAIVIQQLNLIDLFAGDAITYDYCGEQLALAWRTGYTPGWLEYRLSSDTSGWGMIYWVAGIYSVTGRNPLAIQFLNAVVGAGSALVVYAIAEEIYGHRLVARRAALCTAFFPSMILWSSQGLKDPLIVLGLVLVVYAALKARRGLSMPLVALVGLGFFATYALRFYVAYILAAAIVFSVLFASAKTAGGFARQLLLFGLVGFALMQFGVGDQAARHYETISLERIQLSRSDLALRAQSGYGSEIDITEEGALWLSMPLGFVYLLFAPFPWQLGSVRQAMAMPEMLVWYAMIPLLISGIVYSVRHRLADCTGIIVFTVGLIVAYSLMQGNVGTAYRQRSQVLVFLFIFAAVGFTLRQIRRGTDPPSVSPPGASEAVARVAS